MSPHPRIEALETRIAPANFFLSGMGKTVVDATGADANNTAAQTLAQSDIAVLLGKGDSLILDTDGDHVFDADETRLVMATSGTGFVFATDFNSAGKIKTDFDADDDLGYSVVVQSDGKIVVAGTTSNGTDLDFALVRYNSDGSLDTSFGTGGRVTTPIGSEDDVISSLALQSDGKIIVAGVSHNGSNKDFALVRYTTAGALDTTFNVTGIVITPIGTGDDIANSLALQTDGKIVAAGSSSNGSNDDFALVRYTTAGALDTTFNGNGKVAAPIDGGDIAYDVAIQADGRIVVGGETNAGANSDFVTLRFTTTGVLDTTFNGSGKVRTPIGSGADSARTLAIQSDGHIVLAGSAVDTGSDSDFAVARYTASGILDTTFTTGANGRFEINELTGLAVSDGFQGQLGTGVNGSIVTALDATSALIASSTTLFVQQKAAIDGLEIAGALTGNIFTGGAMKNISVTGIVSGNLATGTAVNASDAHTVAAATSFNGGGKTFIIAAYTPLAGEHGGSISDVRLDHGAKNVLAGRGGDNHDGAPGRGGSISRVAITIGTGDPVAWFIAGDGGKSNTSSGARGGSLTGITARLTAASTTDALILEAGEGGRGSGTGSGGAGGGISDSFVVTNGSIGGSLSLLGGAGGRADGTGAGGSGGAIANTSVHVLGASETVKKLALAGGAGGLSVLGAGGAGGGILGTFVITEATIGDAAATGTFDIGGGAGGSGKTRGGAGGAITDGSVFIRGDVKAQAANPAFIHGGTGGALSAAATAKSIAGKGGAISDFVLAHFADITAGITLAAGDGGTAAAATAGRGGAGGALSASVAGSGGASTGLIVKAGAGGASPNGSGDGGAGGGIANTTIHEAGTLKSLTVSAGAGAAANSGASGAGGAGGAIKTTRITTGDVTGTVNVQAGAGGNGAGLAAGAGGGITGLVLHNAGSVAGGILFTAGAGGAAAGDGAAGAGGAITGSSLINSGGAKSIAVTGGAGGSATRDGAGGAGGGIVRFTLDSLAAITDASTIAAGAGGGAAAAGGAGGKIGTLVLRTFDSNLAVNAGAGGASSGAGKGGAGGAIDGVSGAVDLVSFTAGAGGSSTSGTGGAGGAARNIDLDLVGRFVRALIAGNGGNGSVAGAGGSVSLVSIAGDIGDFTQPFGTTAMGGIFAGQAGKVGGAVVVTKSGTITSVSADRITAMIAGTPAANGLSAANAVRRIAKITTDQLGADVDGDSVVDVTEAPGANPPGYTLGNSLDTLLDGIVLVRSGGLGKVPTLPNVAARFNVVEV